MTAGQKIPPWALPDEWEKDETSFFQIEDRVALTICRNTTILHRGPRLYVRLFVNQVFVAGAKILGPGNIDVPKAHVLCDIEVHPEHRSHRYSSLLLRLVQQQIGVVYMSGMVSKSGYANIGHWNLPLVPGRKIDVQEQEEYSFIDWTNGRFHD